MCQAQPVPGAASLGIRRSEPEPDNTSTATVFRRLNSVFIPQRSGFYHGSLEVRYMVGEVAHGAGISSSSSVFQC